LKATISVWRVLAAVSASAFRQQRANVRLEVGPVTGDLHPHPGLVQLRQIVAMKRFKRPISAETSVGGRDQFSDEKE
jgi:hypothetical protein